MFIGAFRTEIFWSGELSHVRKDGREVVVDSRMQVLRDNTVLEVNAGASAHRATGDNNCGERKKTFCMRFRYERAVSRHRAGVGIPGDRSGTVPSHRQRAAI